jgi:hypothetical protein
LNNIIVHILFFKGKSIADVLFLSKMMIQKHNSKQDISGIFPIKFI